MADAIAYTAELLRADDGSVDVRVLCDGRARHLGGRRGATPIRDALTGRTVRPG